MPAEDRRPEPRVAILLSTFDGARFLPEQLASFVAQTEQDWVLHWRDDGSSDGSVEILSEFAAQIGNHACRRLETPDGRVGACVSFLSLLAGAVASDADLFAFADQDDVWLPEKLARGRDSLAQVPADTPALYCARQILVDATLRPIGESYRLNRVGGFPMSLTQNIATGCTVMLNRAAAKLIAGTRQPPGTVHDWWSYLVVSAAGGSLLMDDTPVVLYRQHEGNMVGAPINTRRRAIAALRRGPGVFMAVFRQHVEALEANPQAVSPAARADIAAIKGALAGGRLRRLWVLTRRGLRRQRWHETLLFRIWFLVS